MTKQTQKLPPNIRLWIANMLSSGPARIGIRSYLDGRTVKFLGMNWLAILIPREQSPGEATAALHALSQHGRRIHVYVWMRDEFGTTDGAGYRETKTIEPGASYDDISATLNDRGIAGFTNCVPVPRPTAS